MDLPVRNQLINLIRQTLTKTYPGVDQEIILDTPPQKAMGDYATNLAMMLARPLKLNPLEIAQALKDNLLDPQEMVDSVEIKKPGFLNFRIKPRFWIKGLELIWDQKETFGISKDFHKKKALVEFVSANPTGPLHVGHGRGAVVGDTLARLLGAVGYEVTREYYVNDGGIQMNNLGRSAHVRYRQLLGESLEFPSDGYQGEYMFDIARELLERKYEFEGWDEERLILYFGEYAGNKILDEIKTDLKNTGIVFDSYFFESTLYRDGRVEKTLHELKEKNLAFEKEGALWLESTKFGDDKDRVLIKQDGTYTYLTPDIAYHRHKFERGYDLLVNIWGADHAGYGPRLKAALKGLGLATDHLHILFIQMVNLIKGGEVLSMSTRRAQYETLESVVSRVGQDAARYFFMQRSYQAQLDFDVELASRQSSENPVYYIQYAHARICSIFAKAAGEQKSSGQWPEKKPAFESLLKLPEEISLSRYLLDYPFLIKEAALEFAPHRVAFYVLELARNFQSYYDRARSDERYRILQGDPPLIEARLYLLGCIRQVLQNALHILGVSAPERM